MEVEEALVRSVGGCTGPKGGGKKVDVTTVGELGLRSVKVFEFATAVGKGFDDFEGSSFGDGEFCDAVGGGRAVDFDLGGDDVAWLVSDEFPGGVGAVGGGETSIFSEVSQDLCGEA